jgi:hypothetical protein
MAEKAARNGLPMREAFAGYPSEIQVLDVMGWEK